MTNLEDAFHVAMLEAYDSASADCDYDPSDFLSTVKTQGGLQAARTLLRAPGISDGSEALRRCGQLDLAVEAMVLKHQWQPLFTDEELALARRRLKEMDWDPPPVW